MKEEVLTKAIELKKQLDCKRRVLKLGNSVYTSIKVYFEDDNIHENARITDDILKRIRMTGGVELVIY